MSAKEIIINLIDKQIITGDEAYALIEAVTSPKYINYLSYPLTWNTSPSIKDWTKYEITC